VEIAMWVDDSRVEEIVRRVVEVARTGRMGDGKIFVLPGESYETVIAIGGEAEEAEQKKPARRTPGRKGKNR
jgi:nitrogen regulatory protein P-II 1